MTAIETFSTAATAVWRTCARKIARAIEAEQRNRVAIERELFRGEYMPSSKSDDNLPIP